MRRALIGLICAALLGVGVGLAGSAQAAGQPVITTETVTPTVVLYATVGSTATVTADVVPSDPSETISTVTAAFRVHNVIAGHVNSIENIILSSTDGEHWSATVSIPRNAAPGSWDAFVFATDSALTQETSSAEFHVYDNTHLTLGFSPSDPRALGTVTFSGTLHDMHPGSSGTALGSYQPYPGKVMILLSPERQAIGVTTNSKGQFSYSAQVWSSGVWSIIFGGTTLHVAVTTTADVTTVRNSTRFSAFNVTPEPAYRHGYLHFVGTLQRNDPNGSDWLPYRNRTFTVYRDSPGTFAATATTDADGNFDFTLHGVHSTVSGTWYADFGGSIYNAPSLSRGDNVLVRTPPLKITTVSYNPAGADSPITNTKLNEEYVTVTNSGDHTANLVGWALHDVAGHVYSIDHDVYLSAGQSVSIHVGAGTDTSANLYWGLTGYVWNNTGDTASLVDDLGATYDTCTWGDTGASSTSC